MEPDKSDFAKKLGEECKLNQLSLNSLADHVLELHDLRSVVEAEVALDHNVAVTVTGADWKLNEITFSLF